MRDVGFVVWLAVVLPDPAGANESAKRWLMECLRRSRIRRDYERLHWCGRGAYSVFLCYLPICCSGGSS